MNEIQEAIDRVQAKGWTLAALADEMGVSRLTVYRWKLGVVYPRSAVAVVLLLRTLEGRKEAPKRRRPKGKKGDS